MTRSLADQIDDLLPQTQCTKCGYTSCRAYASAIAEKSAAINQCPPGGAEGISTLSSLLCIPVEPLNPLHGDERRRRIAIIDEAHCIGCTLCISACPVDAIVGAPKQMHTVIAEYCTGCDLCLAPCPVDCIAMAPSDANKTGWAAWSPEQATAARSRHEFRLLRLQRDKEESETRLAAKAHSMPDSINIGKVENAIAAEERKKAAIRDALQRARMKMESQTAKGDVPLTPPEPGIAK